MEDCILRRNGQTIKHERTCETADGAGPVTVPAPRPGEILVLGEAAYRFGIGPVVLRVAEIVGLVEFDGLPWWEVAGEVANGTPARHGGWVGRTVYVDAAAIPAARRAPPT